MHRVLREVAVAFGLLFVISVLVFLGCRLLPGDQATATLGGSHPTAEQLEALRDQLGLNRPLVVQYGDWVLSLLHGDLGTTANGNPVIDELTSRLPTTAALLALTVLIMVPLGLLLGCLSALHVGGRFDKFTSGVTLVTNALPEFVVGVGLIYLLATGVLGVFPAVSQPPPGDSVLDHPEMMVLPLLTLILLTLPYFTRMVRAVLIDVLRSDYVEMARLKGMSTRRVLVNHALPNALAPSMQVLTLLLTYLAGGTIIVETVFSYPGTGLAIVQAIRLRDVNQLQALALVVGLFYVVVSRSADLGSFLTTPRLRTGR
ncbi:ABC transporter permease [Nocardioides sp.]|uniref:ABC transporter permease n=1 Tax=Nocardioides sp. TaxID=35761 RepID=UPI003D0A72A5